MNQQGRPTRPTGELGVSEPFTRPEPLIFEQGQEGRCGVDLPAIPDYRERLGGLRRTAKIGLPGLSEPQVVRHYTRLSQ